MIFKILSELLSKRHGIEKSLSSSVISAIVSHIIQQGFGRGGRFDNLFHQGSNYSDNDRIGGIQSVLSNLIGQRDGGQLNQDHSINTICSTTDRHTRHRTGKRIYTECFRFDERTC